MNLRLFFDNETTGIPDWQSPSNAETQPHLVQLAAKLVDIDKREVIDSMNEIIKPEGWVIPQEVIDIHGITMDRADAEGISEREALEEFLLLWHGNTRVAHGVNFDNRIIRIGTKRYCDDDTIDEWKNGSYECTGRLSKEIMSPGQKGFKIPKLVDAYKFFTGKDLIQTHDAMQDVDACIEVYFSIMDHKERQAV